MAIIKEKLTRLEAWLARGHTDRLVMIFGASLALCIWLSIGFLVTKDEQQTELSIQRENANLARAFAEHSTRTLKSVDQAVLFLKFQYEKLGPKINIADYVKEGMIISQIFNQLGVIDEHGMYIMSSLPSFKPMYLGDREHFQVHQKNNSNELFVSKPVLGRASGKWSLQLTRRINKPDGSFGGVVVVSLDPFYFSDFYSGVNLGKNGVVTLLGLDGIVRARRAGDDVSVGQNLNNSPLMNALATAKQGSYINTSVVDGITRHYSYQQLEGYPLAVAVGVATKDAMSEFRLRRLQFLGLGAISTLFIGLFTALVVQMLVRQKRITADLRESQLKAESANQMKSEFLANMSHELRTPINGILGYAEYLAEDCQDPTHQLFANTILSSSQHLLEVVNTVLDLAKIEAGKMGFNPSKIHIRSMADELVTLHRVTAQQKYLKINCKLDTDVPDTFISDHTKLVQVLNNLLHNAIKFTDQGEITLAVSKVGNRIRFAVQDTGCGIPPELHQAIFERFRQVEAFETRSQGGTGLGLALVRELMVLLGGQLGLESAVDQGTLIYFDLPLAPAE